MKSHLHLFYFIKSDLARYRETWKSRGEKPGMFRVTVESLLFKAGFQAVLLFRISHFFHHLGLNYLAWAISRINLFLSGAEIEFNAEIGEGLMIAHPHGIVIGRGSRLGKNITMYQGITFGVKDLKPENIKKFPVAEDNVTLFAGAKVIGGVTVGKGSSVGANSVVVEDIPPGSTAVGVPAKITKTV